MKKLLCVLLSAIFLAGCGGQAIAPTPTPVATPTATPSPTPEATPEPEPTPTPVCVVPPPEKIPDDMLVWGGTGVTFDPTGMAAMVGFGQVEMDLLLQDRLNDPENADKYFAVEAQIGTMSAIVLAYYDTAPSEWFAQRGFRIVRDEAAWTVRMIGTKEMILGLEGRCPGMQLSLFPVSLTKVGAVLEMKPEDKEQEMSDIYTYIEEWDKMMAE